MPATTLPSAGNTAQTDDVSPVVPLAGPNSAGSSAERYRVISQFWKDAEQDLSQADIQVLINLAITNGHHERAYTCIECCTQIVEGEYYYQVYTKVLGCDHDDDIDSGEVCSTLCLLEHAQETENDDSEEIVSVVWRRNLDKSIIIIED